MFGFKSKNGEDTGEVKVPGTNGNDPLSARNRIERYIAIRNGGWAVLRTVDYDDERGEYRMTEEMVKREDLPMDAVHCTGEPGYYALDMMKVEYGPHDNEFAAMNACLYMDCNKISDGLAVKWSGNIPWKAIGVAVAVAAVAIVAYLIYLKG